MCNSPCGISVNRAVVAFVVFLAISAPQFAAEAGEADAASGISRIEPLPTADPGLLHSRDERGGITLHFEAAVRHFLPAPSTHRYTEGKSALGIPFRISGNHIVLPLRINGSRELDIVLDTGMAARGIGIIHPGICDELGLKQGKDSDGLASVTLSLPGIEFFKEDLVVYSDSMTADWPNDGVIGLTIFGSCITEIDYDNKLINLYDPSVFLADGAGEMLKLEFLGNTPFIDAVVVLGGKEKIPVTLIVDTGCGMALYLFTDLNDNIHPPGKVIGKLLGTGLSGDIVGRLGRISGLRLGSIELRGVLAGFTGGMTPLPGGRRADGIIGNWALRRFNVVIDYPGGRIFIKPNGRFEKPFEYNMAGLLLRRTHEGLRRVCDVIEHSPGALAGIRRGDVLIAVEGRDVLEYDDDELSEALRTENKTIEVTVKRGKERFNRILTLKRLI